jgi:hypothetical protein
MVMGKMIMISTWRSASSAKKDRQTKRPESRWNSWDRSSKLQRPAQAITVADTCARADEN